MMSTPKPSHDTTANRSTKGRSPSSMGSGPTPAELWGPPFFISLTPSSSCLSFGPLLLPLCLAEIEVSFSSL